MPETVPVTYTVTAFERVRGAGRLVGLAVVEVDVQGVIFTLQGVQVTQEADGSLACRSPVWRHPKNGQSVPCMQLPPALAGAIAGTVIGCMEPQAEAA